MIESVKIKTEDFIMDTAIQNMKDKLVFDTKIGTKVFQGWKRYEEAEEEE